MYLDKKHSWLSEGVPYVDRIKYAETQKEKKLGFGTSDFSKRDEFSMDFSHKPVQGGAQVRDPPHRRCHRQGV